MRFNKLKDSINEIAEFISLNYRRGQTFVNQIEFDIIAKKYADYFLQAKANGISKNELENLLTPVNDKLNDPEIKDFFFRIKQTSIVRNKKTSVLN